MLAEHLPPDAAVWRVNGDDQVWSKEHQEIVNLRDDVRSMFAGEKYKPLARPSDQLVKKTGGKAAANKALERAAKFRARSS